MIQLYKEHAAISAVILEHSSPRMDGANLAPCFFSQASHP